MSITQLPPPLQRLGKKQRAVLLKMCDGWHVSAQSFDDGTENIRLIDTEGDVREILSNDFLARLVKRDHLFARRRWHPALGVVVEEFRLHPRLRDETKLILGKG